MRLNSAKLRPMPIPVQQAPRHLVVGDQVGDPRATIVLAQHVANGCRFVRTPRHRHDHASGRNFAEGLWVGVHELAVENGVKP